MRTEETPCDDIDPAMTSKRGETAYDLSLALNYVYAAGSPQIPHFITEHVELIHNPPYADWECSMTCGTTSAIDLDLQILRNKGDSILVEEYSYPGAIFAMKAQRLNIVGVRMDAQGLSSEDLDLKLRAWNTAMGKKPAVLFMIPTGQNPTGISQSIERRKSILAVAEVHDLVIIEDDPYLFLRLGSRAPKTLTLKVDQDSHDHYLSLLPASYLSMDTSGRVIRLDTMSKILASGLRCGWLTVCAQIVSKFVARTEVTTAASSGVSQVMLYKLLDQTWGHEGFIDWL